MSSGPVAPITVEEEASKAQQQSAAEAEEEEGEESDSAIGDNYADDDLRDEASFQRLKMLLNTQNAP